ncbi:DUF937 domain-containing protein [Notoacmeibacter sp. MSK16QG-6]|uniref:DUF937 domain-containing protein n=1 Tax=Notoacmeibacter sp. MSK16QG-6 TaxID=2957982 RepID=UPI00209D8FD8|nr:DUF937 domain-containing protein [Notoacmeibacter sp. MSK16QG-6]MCP1198536.1 DUF937 domain-containing protein [Notoacmeibacter sp. MSK16QG-6]
MIPIFPMLSSMNDGALQKQLSEQFALNQQQAVNVLAAMAPAFSEALRRQTATPADTTDFMAALSSGRHAPYGFDVTKAFEPNAINQAQNILNQLFRSAGLMRAITDQVANETGVPREDVQRMLPVIASAVMGGITRQMTEFFVTASEAAPRYPEAQPAPASKPAKPKQQQQDVGMLESIYGPAGRVWDEMWAPFIANAQTASGSTRGMGGFGDMMEMFFSQPRSNPEKNHTADGIGMVPPGMPLEPEPSLVDEAADPDSPESDEAENTSDTLFGPMFAAGEAVSRHQIEAMEKLFDQFGVGSNKD